MPDRPTPYRVTPLAQAVIPQRLSAPTPPPEPPVNLYKPLKTKQQGSTRSPKPEAAPKTTSATQPTETKRPRREYPRPEQTPILSQSQQAEAQGIAQRVKDTSQSNRLEQLLRRQQQKRYDPSASYRQPLMELAHLSVAKRSDQRYQIVIQGTKQPVSGHVFTTLEHCAEAAAELEHRFVLGPVLGTEVAEAVDGIVRAAVAREFVQRWCAVA